MGIKVENVVLEGRVKYPKVHRAVKKYKSEDKQYEVLVECSTEKHKKLKAKGCGLKLRTDEEDGRTYLRVTAPELTKAGQPTEIEVKDTDGKDLSKDVLIGNGSKAKVLMKLMTLDNGTTITRLGGLELVELVEYKPDPNKAPKSGFDDAEVI